ncbi:hypothetical protein scyTo_0021426 [Scyliorhinus torazame]|uniref:AHNAK nucleoprotein n=1 Tax=Scyliorhinus torazame TaxID=75743 RepID=A0A401Q876_SCYTO|nr:hypothetical protein [Scyliorhinus torazame]
MTDMDIQNPEFKIKVPRYEQVTIERSGPQLETPEMDVDLNLPGAEGLKFQMGDGKRTTHTMHIVKTKVVEVAGPDTEHGQATFHMPQMNIAGGGRTVQTSDLDITVPKTTVKGQVVDISTSGAKTVISSPTTDADLNISGYRGDFKGPKIDVQTSKMYLDGSRFNTQDGRLNVKMKAANFNVSASDAKEIPNAKVTKKCTIVDGADLDISTKFPEANIKLSGPKIAGGIQMPVAGGFVSEIKGPKVKTQGFNVSTPRIATPDIDEQQKCPTVEHDIDAPDINLHGGIKGPKFNISGPAIRSSEFDLDLKDPNFTRDVAAPDVNLGGDLQGLSVNVKRPKLPKAPGVKGSTVTFSTPSITVPNVNVPSVDLNLRGQDVKPDHGIDRPFSNVGGNIKGPKVDVDVPEADIKGPSGKFHVPKFNMPRFGMGGGKLEGPDLGIDANLPEGDVKLTGPQIEGGVDVPDINLDIEGGKIKGPKSKMPQIHISGPNIKKPDFDVEFKGPKMSGDVAVPDIDLGGDLKGPDVTFQGHNAKGGGFKMSMPSIGIPKIKTPDFDLHLKGPEVKGGHDVGLPSANIQGEIKGPKVDVDVPEADIKGPSGKFHVPKFSMPRFGMGGGKLEGPSLDIDANLPEGDVKLTGPKIEGGVDVPDVDLDIGGSGKIKGPKFQMPQLNISGPKIKKPDLDVHLKGPKVSRDFDVPDLNLEGDLKGPDVNIKGPKVDIEGPDVKGSGLKFGMPTVKMPSVNVPEFDSNLKGPKLKGDHEIGLPAANIEGEIKGPKVDVDVPEADIKGPSGKFRLPKFKMPSFGMGGGTLEGPGLDIDANLPEGDVKLTGPQIEGTVDVPDVDLDIEGGKIKGPKFKMQKFNVSGPMIKKPDFDVEFKGPKMSGDVAVPDIDLEGDLKGPDVNIQGPNAKGGGFKMSMPSIDIPKIKTPDFDLKLKGPKLKGDHEIGLPSANIQGEIKGPKVDVGVPEADIKGPSGKFHMPKFSMPRFGMGGGKLEGPDLDIDANLPEGDVKLTGPKIEGGVDVPDVDLDIGGSGKTKGPKFKMPQFNISGPKIKKPDLDVHLKGPKVSGDVDIPDLNLEGDLKGPNVSIKGPKVDIEGPDVKGSGLKFAMPSMKLPSMHVPEFDLELKGPKLKGDHEIGLPSANIEGEITGPKVDVDVPEADIKGPSGKFHMPKFKMPSFGMGGGKLEGPGLDIDANLPEGDINLTGPQIEGAVDVPDVDLDVDGGSGKIRGPKFKMPKINIAGPTIPKADFGLELKGPKLSGDVNVPDVSLEGDLKGPKFKKPGISFSGPKITKPDLDLELKGPKLSGDVDVPGIHMGHDIKGQNLNIKGPKVDIDGPGVKGSGPMISMPSIGFPHIKAPDFDLNFQGPKIKGDQNIGLSSPNIEGEIKGPQIGLETPDVDLEGAHGQFRMPKIKVPTFKMGGSKLEGPDLDFDATLPDTDVNLSGRKIKGGVEVPDVDVDADGKIKGPGFQMPGFNISLPKMKPPNFDLRLKGPDLTSGGIAADINVESDVKGPEFDIKGPKVDIEGPDLKIEGPDAKGSGHKISMPSLNISAPNISTPGMDFDLKGPKLEGTADVKSPSVGIDVRGPEMDAHGHGAHLKMPKIKKPKFGFGTKGPQGDINAPSLDISGADVDLNVDSPDLNISTKGKKGKFKMPKFNIKSKKPAGDVRVTVPKGDLDLSKPDADIYPPDLNVSLGSSDGQLNVKPSKVKKPRFGKMKLSFPDVEFDLASPKFKGDIPSPTIEGDLQAPDIDVSTAGIKGPHVDIKGPGIDVNTDIDLEGPGFKAKGTKLKLPSVNIKSPKTSGPNLDVNLKGTNLKGDLSGDVTGPTVDIKRPEIDFDVDAPNVDIDKPEDKLKMKMKKPKFNILGPKFKGSGVDVELGAPKLEGGIKGPGVHIAAPSIDLQPKISAPDLHLQGPSLKGDVSVSDPTMECDIKGPSVNLDTSGQGVGGKLKMPKLKFPSFGVDHKATGPDMNVNISLPKADLSGPKLDADFNVPSADIKIGAPGVNIGGHDAKVKGSGFEMPSLKVSGPKVSSPGFDLKGDIKSPQVDVKGPKLDFKMPNINFEGAEGNLEMPEMNVSGSKLQGSDLNLGIHTAKIGGDLKTVGFDANLEAPDVDINAGGKFKGPQNATPSVGISSPKLDIDLKNPQLKGDVNIFGPDIKGDFRGPDVNVKGPNIDVGAADIGIKGGGGKLKMPQVKLAGQKIGGVSAPDFNISVKEPKLEGNLAADLSGPKIDADIKCPKVDVKGPDMKMDMPDINFGGLKGKGPSVDFNVPKANIGFSEPRFAGDMKGDIDFGVSDVKFGAKGPTIKGGVGISGFKGDTRGPELGVKAPDASADIKATLAELDIPLHKMTIPKFKHSQFEIKGLCLEGPEMTTGASVSGQLNASSTQGASSSIKGPQASVSLPEGEVESSGVKVKKGKIKIPKFNFSKSKGKSSAEGAEGEFSVSGPKIDVKGSKGSLGFGDIEMEGAEVAASGKGPGLDVSASPKGKSGTLDFSLFRGKKSERHRSSSLSDEHEHSPTSPKGRIELGEGAAGAKGKKSKLKFGTFGGFGAKSKGSYEVTLGEGEAAGEGSGISLVSKKSRLSSSSSSESGARAGFRLPKVELNINKNKE